MFSTVGEAGEAKRQTLAGRGGLMEDFGFLLLQPLQSGPSLASSTPAPYILMTFSPS